MKGWQIFEHSVRLVLRNLGAAFKVSAVLYLIQVAAQVYAFNNPALDPQMLDMDNPDVQPDMGALGNYLILSLASLVASLWIAVAWHRYVLAEEYPTGWLPAWHGGFLLSYLGRSLLIGIIVAVAIMIVSIPAGMIALALPGGLILMFAVMLGVSVYITFRLGVMLPAAAMGKSMTLSESWKATASESGSIMVLGVIAIGAGLILQLPSLLGGSGGTVISLIYNLVTGWFAMIIGVSVLTTLYGHMVEGRAID